VSQPRHVLQSRLGHLKKSVTVIVLSTFIFILATVCLTIMIWLKKVDMDIQRGGNNSKVMNKTINIKESP